MTPKVMGEIIARIDERTENLVKWMEKSSNEGFPRCADRGARLRILEENYIWWKGLLIKGGLGAVFTASVTAIIMKLSGWIHITESIMP